MFVLRIRIPLLQFIVISIVDKVPQLGVPDFRFSSCQRQTKDRLWIGSMEQLLSAPPGSNIEKEDVLDAC